MSLPPDAGRDEVHRSTLDAWVAQAREDLERERKECASAAGRGSGVEAARRLARATEDHVRTAWLLHLRAARANPATRPRAAHVALLATGGFGRGELCPRSDIDLLILVPEPPGEAERALLTSFQRALFDARLDLAAAVRTEAECLAAIGADIETATALIEAHRIAGDRGAASRLLAAHAGALRAPEGIAWFVRERLVRRRARRRAHGEAVCVQEPNVKLGRGGLRELHEAAWLAWALEGHRDIAAIAAAGLLDEQDAPVLERARDALLRVRHRLHDRHTRPRDVLEFADQAALAEGFGHRASPHVLPEEAFMREVYHRALDVDRLTDRIIRRLLRRHGWQADGTRARPVSDDRTPVPPYYAISHGALRLDPARVAAWEADPDAVLGAFVAVVESGAPPGSDLREQLRQRLGALELDAFRRSAASRDAFLRVLGARGRAGGALRAMHETGVLDAYLPEFARLNALVRADHYHRYTVDEHTLRAIEQAESLLDDRRAGASAAAPVAEPGGSPGGGDALRCAARRIARWDLLVFGLLLHDIGKGEGKGHVLTGAQIAQRIADRLDLDERAAETIHFLVIEHLKMSHLSQRRDLSDPSVIAQVAAAVKTPERLDMLFVLTFADTSAVAPGVWNAWKEQLLVECHERTGGLLGRGGDGGDGGGDGERGGVGGGDGARLPPGMVQAVGIVLEQRGIARPAAELARLLDNFPPGYFRLTPPDLVARHIELLLRRSPLHPIEWQLFHNPRYDTSDLVLCGPDAPGLFRLVARALASKRINIHQARANATMDGVVTDHFQISYRGRPVPETMNLDRVRSLLNAVLRGEMSEQEAFGPVPPLEPVDAAREQRAPTRVTLDNATSATHSIIEVKTSDRPGLLAAVCEALTGGLGVFIHQALISTEAYRVVDVFYVTNLDNEKLVEDRATKGALSRLEERLRGEVAGA